MNSRRLIGSSRRLRQLSDKPMRLTAGHPTLFRDAMPMSALGQKRTSTPSNCDVRFTPESGHQAAGLRCPLSANSGHRAAYSITSSARASSVGGIVEAERLGGLEVDHQLELGRLHHRQIGWLLALENAPGVEANLAIGFDKLVP